jgi:exopolysaccharide production protein ExoQ
MPRWYRLVVSFYLLQSIAAFSFVDRLVYGESLGKTGDMMTQTLNLLLILASMTLFVRAYRRTRSIGVGGVIALVLVAFLFLTAFWSVYPAITERQAILYLFVVLGAIGIAGTMESDEYMRQLTIACLISAVASLVLVAILPGTALQKAGFRGVFPHKNVLGEVMVTGSLASLYSIRVARRFLRNFVMLILFLGVALASGSATSCIRIFMFVCTEMITSLYRKGGAALLFGVLLTIVLVPILALADAYPDVVLGIVGKDPTLTGRTVLWVYVIDYIWQKPTLGWGYVSFWSLENPIAQDINTALGWPVVEAHNGLLEMMLEVGVVGTAIFVFLWARNLVLAIRCLRTPAIDLAISAIIFSGGLIVVGISEQVLMEPNQSSTTVFFILGLMCEKAVRHARRQKYARGRDRTFTRSHTYWQGLTKDATIS